MKQALLGPRIYSGETFFDKHALLFEAETVVGIVAKDNIPNEFIVNDVGGGVLAPGFIDLQVNGGGGVLFNNSPTKESLKSMTKAHQFFGTTSIMPTVISDSIEKLEACGNAVKEEIKVNSAIVGLHIEGPFFSQKYRGIHSEHFITEWNPNYIELIQNLKELSVILTIAPECVPLDQIKLLSTMGVKLQAGHTDANFDRISEAINCGLNGFTHLYNAMSQISPREPGVVGASLHFDKTVASIIVDCHHVHPSLVQLAFKQKPKGKLFFVSDAMATIHNDDSFELYGEVLKNTNGKIVNAAGKLAGSSITQIDAIKNAVNVCNIPLDEALSMASRYPAEYLGIDNHLGYLKSGYRADIVHFDSSFDVLNVWASGKYVKKGNT
jgi:N-acetylglucosamine-6-phosphate deacetylase